MKRKGQKEIAQSVTDVVLYDREVECANAGITAVYAEEKQQLSTGRILKRLSNPALVFPFPKLASCLGDALAEENGQHAA